MVGFQKMMKQAQKMQEDIKQLRVEGTSGGGAVKVVITGDRQVESIKIDPSVVNPEEVDLLEDLVQAAFQQAAEELEKQYQMKVSKMMPGGLPGMGF